MSNAFNFTIALCYKFNVSLSMQLIIFWNEQKNMIHPRWKPLKNIEGVSFMVHGVACTAQCYMQNQIKTIKAIEAADVVKWSLHCRGVTARCDFLSLLVQTVKSNLSIDTSHYDG